MNVAVYEMAKNKFNFVTLDALCDRTQPVDFLKFNNLNNKLCESKFELIGKRNKNATFDGFKDGG